MTDSIQVRADRHLEAALRETGATDPRPHCREGLRALKEANPDAFQQAVVYYRSRLLPAVADGAEPLATWTEYGCRIAELTCQGRTVAIDETGLARDYEAPAHPDCLVLHLPRKRNRRALLVGLASAPSAAQQATYDLLVAGRLSLPRP